MYKPCTVEWITSCLSMAGSRILRASKLKNCYSRIRSTLLDLETLKHSRRKLDVLQSWPSAKLWSSKAAPGGGFMRNSWPYAVVWCYTYAGPPGLPQGRHWFPLSRPHPTPKYMHPQPLTQDWPVVQGEALQPANPTEKRPLPLEWILAEYFDAKGV